MTKKKNEPGKPLIEKDERIEVTESNISFEKSMELLESKLNILNKRIIDAEQTISELELIAKNARKILNKVDNLFVEDITKRYGFDGECMYYIGSASGHIYKKPIDKEIVELIQNINVQDWRGIQKINRHFMAKD